MVLRKTGISSTEENFCKGLWQRLFIKCRCKKERSGTVNLNTASDMDVANLILEKAGYSIYWRDLIAEVIRLKHKSVQSMSAAMAEIYTQLNMDSRFYHVGDGRWALTAWKPVEVKRGSRSSAKATVTDRRKESMFESIQE